MANGDGKAPIGAAIGAGINFVRANVATLAPAAAFTAFVNTGANVLVSANPALTGVAFAIIVMAGIAYQGFVLRLAIRQDRSGFLGLKLGMDEARLLGVTFAVAFPLVIVAFIGMFVVSWVVAMTATAQGVDLRAIQNDQAAMAALVNAQFTGPNAAILWAIVAVLFAVVLYITARLAIAPAATIGERRMLALSTFSWTHGNALPIIVALAPFVLMAGATSILAQQASTAGSVGAAIQFVLALLLYVVIGAGQLGVTAFLYRGFRPPDLPPPAQ